MGIQYVSVATATVLLVLIVCVMTSTRYFVGLEVLALLQTLYLGHRTPNKTYVMSTQMTTNVLSARPRPYLLGGLL